MIDIRLSERMIYKLTGLLPRSFPLTDDLKSSLKEMLMDVESVIIHEHEIVELLLNVELYRIKVFIKLFKLEIPLFKKRRTSGKIKVKLYLKMDKKARSIIVTPYLKMAKLRGIPAPMTFLFKIIYNIFLKNKSRLHIELEDIPLEDINSKRKVVLCNISTHNKFFHIYGRLDNHPGDQKLDTIRNKSLYERHKNKDIIAVINTEFLEELFFEIIPKHYSTGISGLPDVDFTEIKVDLVESNKVKVTLNGQVSDFRKNPFVVSVTSNVNYIENRKHIQLSQTDITKIDIDNAAYNSLKNIIELFIKAYLTIPIPLPNPDPVTIPIEEWGHNLTIRFSNPSYNIDKNLFIASFDTYS